MKALHNVQHIAHHVGQRSVNVVDETGYLCSLFFECLYWTVLGRRNHQPVRLSAVLKEAMQIGITALLIIGILCMAVGVMLAIHSIDLLQRYGQESQVILAIGKSMSQEFAPLIVAILVAGRSGSAITARIGSMSESQEIDALRVIGINPVRFLAAPILLGMLLIVPCITLFGDVMGIMGGALYSITQLKMSLAIYLERTLKVLEAADIWKGLIKSLAFAVLIALVSIGQGFQARGGAEGVGRSTTRSVVVSICCIIITDMCITFMLSRV